MSKEKFSQARALIEKKRYAEARRILETIDHPTAKNWLARLDNLEFQKMVKKSNKSWSEYNHFQKLFVITVFTAFAIGVAYFFIDLSEGREDARDAIDRIEDEMNATRTARAIFRELDLTPPSPAPSVTPEG